MLQTEKTKANTEMLHAKQKKYKLLPGDPKHSVSEFACVFVDLHVFS